MSQTKSTLPESSSTTLPTQIDLLLESGQLTNAHRQFEAFWRSCDEMRQRIALNRSRLIPLDRQEQENTASKNDLLMERNRVALDFQSLINDFRRDTLSSFFDIRGRTEFITSISTRDEVIEEIIEHRLVSKRYILMDVSEQSKVKASHKHDKRKPRHMMEGNSAIIYQLQNVDTGRHAIALVFKVAEITPDIKLEVERLTDLRHRNIIKLIDYDLSNFPYFVITEYVYGETMLKAVSNVGRRPISQTADWLYELADALDYLRHKQILHSNVRPSKIFIDDEWQVMISPFDLNRVGTGETDQKTNRERTLNRFRDVCQYASPELLRQDGDELPLREMCIADQYSLGLLGYLLLTGKDLFKGETVMEILENRQKFIADASYRAECLNLLPAHHLSDVIRKLLSENPAERFPNLHATLRALHPMTRSEEPDLSVVRKSYRRCLAENKELIKDFYRAFHLRLPKLAGDFTPVAKKRLSAMLQMSVDVLIDLEHQQTYFEQIILHQKHAGYSLEQFKTFLDVLVETIGQNDPLWNDDIATEWQNLMDRAMASLAKLKPPKDAPV